MWEKKGYLADPHTAAGLSAAEQYRRESGEVRPTVALSTASPFKFAAAMLSSLGEDVPEDGFAALDALCAFAGNAHPPRRSTRCERGRSVLGPWSIKTKCANP